MSSAPIQWRAQKLGSNVDVRKEVALLLADLIVADLALAGFFGETGWAFPLFLAIICAFSRRGGQISKDLSLPIEHTARCIFAPLF